ncbi:NAC domain-containing protein 78-like [Spinacia oleracea]|uniref:NAC domain-containing protein 78-like n=1 Tax=Spinacia oleracea TaxID=3562 RepID=A0ABM3RRM2_SPIOL|nr:NAC domain-containing protein 78-like [Spinacia oleracea]
MRGRGFSRVHIGRMTIGFFLWENDVNTNIIEILQEENAQQKEQLLRMTVDKEMLSSDIQSTTCTHYSSQPGFRFAPTDQELLLYYLKGKVMGKSLGYPVIAERKKYKIGDKTNRLNDFGYWKSSGNDRTVKNISSFPPRKIGKIKSLVFYKGKAARGERTSWIMYEYRLQDTKLFDLNVLKDSYVIYKLFESNTLGPKIGKKNQGFV